MKAFTTQVNGSPTTEQGTFDAQEANSMMKEGKFIVESTGLTTDASGAGLPDPNTEQLAEAVNRYVGAGDFYVDSGVADAYVLTNIGSFKAVSAAVEGTLIRFRAINANTGASTVNRAGEGLKPLTLQGGTALPASTITTGQDTIARYTTAGGGRYEVLLAGGLVQTETSIQSAFKNLAITTTGTNANITVTADEVVLENTGFTYFTARTVSLVINSAASGANGLDTGSLAADTWYSVWVIYNSNTSTTAGLISLSTTAPTMPAGYTFKARIGWIRTESGVNEYPLSSIQRGRTAYYKIAAGSNLTQLSVIASGVQGTTTADVNTWATVSIVNFVPTTASRIGITPASQGGFAFVAVAPNSDYQAVNNSVKQANAPVSFQNVATSSLFASGSNVLMQLESTNIFVISSAAGGRVLCSGWEDNI